MAGNKCIYLNCGKSARTSPGLKLYYLPRDKMRRKQWILNSGNLKLLDLPPDRTRKVCEHHFHANEIFPSGRLQYNIVPEPSNIYSSPSYEDLQVLKEENARQYGYKSKEYKEEKDEHYAQESNEYSPAKDIDVEMPHKKCNKTSVRQGLSELLKTAEKLDLKIRNILTKDLYNFYKINPTRSRRRLRNTRSYRELMSRRRLKYFNIEKHLKIYYLRTMIRKEIELMNVKISVNKTKLLKEEMETINNSEAHSLRVDNLKLENVIFKLQLQLLMRNQGLQNTNPIS